MRQRYDVADFLSWMYFYEFSIESKRPDPIVSYETLIYPFDNYIWAFAFTLTLATFVLLVIFQVAWSLASGEPNPREWLFQGTPETGHRVKSLIKWSSQKPQYTLVEKLLVRWVIK